MAFWSWDRDITSHIWMPHSCHNNLPLHSLEPPPTCLALPTVASTLSNFLHQHSFELLGDCIVTCSRIIYFRLGGFLFCRQLLSQPQLLPAARWANSIDEFFDDKSVANLELRDLCLKVACWAARFQVLSTRALQVRNYVKFRQGGA